MVELQYMVKDLYQINRRLEKKIQDLEEINQQQLKCIDDLTGEVCRHKFVLDDINLTFQQEFFNQESGFLSMIKG